jgi:hypothetical protein
VTKTAKKAAMTRVNTRISAAQAAFIKAEARKSKGALSEGDVHRALLAEAIEARKAKAN